MHWDARGTIALLVSALVGITAGVIFGVTTGNPEGANANPDGPSSSTTSSPSTNVNDPLRIGAELQNLACTGEQILVVGWGSANSRGALVNAVTSNPDGEVKYLETASSCRTLYGAERQERPDYVAYLGPFDSLKEPCSLRMSVDHARDVVSTLKNGVKIHVPCLCVLDVEDFPVLSVGMVADTLDGIYVRALQRLLIEIGQNDSNHVTGVYDAQTRAMVEPLQKLNALDPETWGVVEAETWQLLRDRGCLNYDF